MHDAPGSERILARVRPRTEFGSPTRLAVVGESGDWLAVISSKLGNRTRGFILRSDVRLTHGPFSVELEFQGEPWPPLDEVNEAMRRSYEHLRGLGLS